MAPAIATSGERRYPYWERSVTEVLHDLETLEDGLTSAEVEARLRRYGTSVKRRGRTGLDLLLRQFVNPIILLLVGATFVSLALGDSVDAAIILVIVGLSGLLGFYQERGAIQAVEALLATVQVHCEVRRNGTITSVPLEQVVPGDVIVLNAGDVIPGDCRVIEAKDLLVDESPLTGESYPAEKDGRLVPTESPVRKRSNSLFMGTHVASGTGTAVVVHTGGATEFGQISRLLAEKHLPTSFERGITRFGYMLVSATGVLVVGIFIVNVILDRALLDSLLFSLALAVGLTPQMLPPIVTISLSRGAHRMAQKMVIVKRLDAIEDFGSMNVLCTDKTGTLTRGSVELAQTLDVTGRHSDSVHAYAYLNAVHQHGLTNPIDDAIVARPPAEEVSVTRLDEIPYDFVRKRLSVLVAEGDRSLLIAKGALAQILTACSTARAPSGGTMPLAEVAASIQKLYQDMSAQGCRVLGIAARSLGDRERAGFEDERDMTFLGFLTFLDPLKEGIADTLLELETMGISPRMITGDNRLIAAHIGSAAGLDGRHLLTGAEIDALTDNELAERAQDVPIFAEVEPSQKGRIIQALRNAGNIVGYLGDGINDAPALHAADVGISVDTAVDVAKQSSAIVLLEKDLEVLADGVRIGRQIFANTMKYIRVTISANFGNMLSMAAAAAFLPFLPLLPRQILLLNFLSDIPAMTISTDAVDPEQLGRPHSWDVRSIRNFMVLFGLISSAFDFLTFGVLRLGFDASAGLFRSGWFVVSVATELCVMLVLRTRRPFFRSRPGKGLLASSIAVALVTVALPFSPAAHVLGLVSLHLRLVVALAAITAGYVLVTEAVKHHIVRTRASGAMD